MHIKLDYTIEDPKERVSLVEKIIASTPPEQLTDYYLGKLSDYIVEPKKRSEERKSKHIMTDNRMKTIKTNETSFEGLVGKFENGEDGIYNLIINDKNVIFTPKVSITEEDIANIPQLRALRQAIESVEAMAKRARGRRAFLLKKQAIEMRQQQYILKNSYNKPIHIQNIIKSISTIQFPDKITVKDGKIMAEGVNFFTPEHISVLLTHYSKLKEDSWSRFNSDSYYMMEDLDNLIERTLRKDYPMYLDLLIYKIDGRKNAEIQQQLYEDYGIRHSVEYISALWRKKIPKMLAERASKDYLTWYYTNVERGKWKRCSRCGQIKLAHSYFFSKNNTSKDGYYSICKECRNKKVSQVKKDK